MSQQMALLSPDMTDAERRMVIAAVRGEVGDLGGATVRGSVLRDLLLEARPGWLLPRHGVSLARMTVSGGIDLDGAFLDKPLTLSEVHVELLRAGEGTAIALGSARLRRLTLHAASVAGAIVADRCEVLGALLIGGGEIAGPLQLRGAVLQGSLAIEGAAIGDGVSAVQAAGLTVDGSLVVRRSRFDGVVSLSRCRLGGNLNGEDVRVEAGTGNAFDIDAARIGGDVILDRAAISRGLALVEARIDGRLSLASASVGEAGLHGARAQIQGTLVATDARFAGPIRIDDAVVAGGISAHGMEVHGGETAVSARRARFGAGVEAESSKIVGTIDLESARIDGELRLSHARLFGSQRAVDARGARIESSCVMPRCVVFGMIDVAAAAIAGRLALNGASLKVDRGAALDARGARISGGVALGDGLDAIGAIRLDQAVVEGGSVSLAGSRISSVFQAASMAGGQPGRAGQFGGSPLSPRDDRVALGLRGLRAAVLEMPAAAEQRPRGIVDLGGARVGEFIDHAAAWPQPAQARPSRGAHVTDSDDVVVLDGFICERLVNPAGMTGDVAPAKVETNAGLRRIAWLEAQPESDLWARFKPQPWREAARHLAEHGLAGEARRVTITALRWQRRTASWSTRWAGRLDDVLTGYGHHPWRPLVALVVVTLVFAAVYAIADAQCRRGGACPAGPAFVAATAAAATAEAPAFNAFAYAVERSLPMLGLEQRRHWRINSAWRPGTAPATSPMSLGLMLGFAASLQSLLGAVLAVLSLAGLVRRPRRV